MKFDDFVSNISFRFISPNFPIPGYYTMSNYFKTITNSLEFYNTRFPCNDKKIKEAFYNLCKIPRMSTLSLGGIINCGVKQLAPGKMFVNVGVWHGFTFLSAMLNNPNKICIGIDNFSEFGGPRPQFIERFDQMKSQNHFFYDMDYEKYFSEFHKGEIGFYIYDGEHSYKNQLKGLQVAEPYLAENSLILIDDTNWSEPRKATIDFMEKSSNEYKIIFDRRTYCNGHPTFWNGVMILKKIGEK